MWGFVTGLITDGFLPVFITLAEFLPTVVILLTIVALFEHSGLILGFSCTSLAISATPKPSRAYIRFLTFIPCSAKLPVLIFIAATILGWSVFGVVFLYLLSILLGVMLGGYKVLAIPRFRKIGVKNFIWLLIRNIFEFLKRISVGLILAVAVLYTLQYFKLLVPLMGIFMPIFNPIGLGNAMVLAALLFGLVAKEMIIGALLSFGVANIGLTTAQAISFIFFVLLYTPCMPTLTAIKSKLGTFAALKAAAFNFAVAYIVSLVAYNVAVLIAL